MYIPYPSDLDFINHKKVEVFFLYLKIHKQKDPINGISMIKKNSIYVFPEKNFAPEKSEQFLKQMLKTRTPNVLMFALLIGKSMLGEDFFFCIFFSFGF